MTAQRPSGSGPVPSARAAGPGRGTPGPPPPDCEDSDLLAALLDGMDAALCAFDADGVVTHWNREAERSLGWSAKEAVGRHGFAGWAVRTADAEEVRGRLMAAMDSPGRRVHEFALLTKDGGRVLVRTQSAAVRGANGEPAGVYCAFSEVHAQIDLERSLALSDALFEDAAWGVVLVDADLRPAVVGGYAARALGRERADLLGRPLGDLLSQGAEELESSLQHVLAEGTPPAPSDLWVTLCPAGSDGTGGGADPADGGRGPGGERAGERAGGERSGLERTGGERSGEGRPGTTGAGPGQTGGERRCWRSGFVRLASPLAEEPVPLGVAWFFQDITETKLLEREGSLLRFRGNQLHRAGLAAAECEDPAEAATVHVDFALAGFADHALLDLLPADGPAAGRLVRAAATPTGAGGPCSAIEPSGIPVGYPEGHPAPRAVERAGSVRSSAAAGGVVDPRDWARARQWPEDSVHALCVVLRSRGRTLGVLTFLRGASRRPFERQDAVYAEDVAVRTAALLDLAGLTRTGPR
ncbi:PAS domain-containing protein [Streptomyces albus]|uniref:PAS domain-containing protein n=1 Tax=Streptomyces albus TaxID=1888 RepID=UPI00055F8F62|nr:PAS domain-containing protein [Streptomyces albus]